MAAAAPGVPASLAEQDQARRAELLFRLFVLLPSSSGTADTEPRSCCSLGTASPCHQVGLLRPG